MQSFMSQLSFDDEDYYFQIAEELEDDKQFILIIYDIVDNKRRVKFAKFLEGYGKRVQKSAFEAIAFYGAQRSPFCFRTAAFRSQRPPIF